MMPPRALVSHCKARMQPQQRHRLPSGCCATASRRPFFPATVHSSLQQLPFLCPHAPIKRLERRFQHIAGLMRLQRYLQHAGKELLCIHAACVVHIKRCEQPLQLNLTEVWRSLHSTQTGTRGDLAAGDLPPELSCTWLSSHQSRQEGRGHRLGAKHVAPRATTQNVCKTKDHFRQDATRQATAAVSERSAKAPQKGCQHPPPKGIQSRLGRLQFSPPLLLWPAPDNPTCR